MILRAKGSINIGYLAQRVSRGPLASRGHCSRYYHRRRMLLHWKQADKNQVNLGIITIGVDYFQVIAISALNVTGTGVDRLVKHVVSFSNIDLAGRSVGRSRLHIRSEVDGRRVHPSCSHVHVLRGYVAKYCSRGSRVERQGCTATPQASNHCEFSTTLTFT